MEAALSLTTELLRFARRAGTERSTIRLLAEMARFIARTFSVYRVGVYVYEGERVRPLVSEYASGEVRPELWQDFRSLDRLEELPIFQRLAAGEDTVLVADPAAEEGFPLEMVEHFGIRPYLAVALREEGRLTGMVLIEGDPAVLEDLECDIAELAGFVALALHNAAALAREQQRAREAEALLEVSKVLTLHTDLTPVLASVAINCAKVTGFNRASIFLLGDDGRLRPTMSQFADGHSDPDAWATFRGATSELPAARRVMETGEIITVEDARKVPDLITPEWAEPFGLRSMMLVPLEAWGSRFGLLSLDTPEVRPITPEQVRIAVGVAAHGGAAIGLARLLAREREAVERLAELDQLKTAFIATVSHELRTPLTSIVGFTQLLAEMVEGEAAEFVQVMRRESLHLESLIANLLDSSRLEAGILTVREDPVDLEEVVEEAVELVSHLHPDRKVEVEVAAGLPRITGDAPCLRQVVVNLVENACKYSSGRIRLQVARHGGAVRLEVEDEGPGIEPEQREQVFERFQRLHRGQESGTGIGLHLVKALVEAHGGQVWVDDPQRLCGCRFVVELPLARVAAAAS